MILYCKIQWTMLFWFVVRNAIHTHSDLYSNKICISIQNVCELHSVHVVTIIICTDKYENLCEHKVSRRENYIS